MKKSDIKIIFVDVDNTLYDHIKKSGFNDKDIDALNVLHEQGILLYVCSARPYYSLKEFKVLEKLKLDGFIGSNGAIRVVDNKWIDRYLFPKDKLISIIEVVKKHSLCLECVTFDNRFYATDKNEYVDLHHGQFFEYDAPREEYINQDVVSLLLFAPKELDSILKEELPNDVSFLRFGDYGVDLVIKQHNKGEGVVSVLNYLNISPDNALAFGDDYQDIAMFKNCKYSVAVGNAKAKLKECATYVTKPVYKHGIYSFLKKNKFIRTSFFSRKIS